MLSAIRKTGSAKNFGKNNWEKTRQRRYYRPRNVLGTQNLSLTIAFFTKKIGCWQHLPCSNLYDGNNLKKVLKKSFTIWIQQTMKVMAKGALKAPLLPSKMLQTLKRSSLQSLESNKILKGFQTVARLLNIFLFTTNFVVRKQNLSHFPRKATCFKQVKTGRPSKDAALFDAPNVVLKQFESNYVQQSTLGANSKKIPNFSKGDVETV